MHIPTISSFTNFSIACGNYFVEGKEIFASYLASISSQVASTFQLNSKRNWIVAGVFVSTALIAYFVSKNFFPNNTASGAIATKSTAKKIDLDPSKPPETSGTIEDEDLQFPGSFPKGPINNENLNISFLDGIHWKIIAINVLATNIFIASLATLYPDVVNSQPSPRSDWEDGSYHPDMPGYLAAVVILLPLSFGVSILAVKKCLPKREQQVFPE